MALDLRAVLIVAILYRAYTTQKVLLLASGQTPKLHKTTLTIFIRGAPAAVVVGILMRAGILS